jgi:hypothetical protein
MTQLLGAIMNSKLPVWVRLEGKRRWGKLVNKVKTILCCLVVLVLFITVDEYQTFHLRYDEIQPCQNDCNNKIDIARVVEKLEEFKRREDKSPVQQSALNQFLRLPERELTLLKIGDISSWLDRMLGRETFVLLVYRTYEEDFSLVVTIGWGDLIIDDLIYTVA